jgi:formylglycine-generating enzyme required for sulfatase activity
MTIIIGLFVGNFVRQPYAEEEQARYKSALAAFNALHSNEKPAHLVTLTQPFYMGKYTVTQAQYAAVMGTNPSHFKGANLPVEMISWDDATAFCSKLNEKLNDKTLAVRLPTEAQWEYACRAGTRTRFYSGDADSDLGWSYSNCGDTTHPVGQKKPNAFGLYDMHGNVWQWCQDCYNENYAAASIIDPLNDEGAERVLRGGSWGDTACRSARRCHSSPVNRGGIAGFRVVVSSSSRSSP